MTDIIDDLKDLLKQAETEKSHYYVAGCCRRAIQEIELLRRDNNHHRDLVRAYSDMARSR